MKRALWAVVIVLAVTGIFAAVMRAVYVDSWSIRADPVRDRVLERLAITDPNLESRRVATAAFDRRYGEHRLAVLLHVVPGAIFLALAPLQLSRRLRTRHLNAHRRLGRVLLVAAFVAGMSGLYIGVFIPFAGTPERLVIATFGTVLIVAIVRGYQTIRRGDTVRHRRWMIRAFAVSLAISVIRWLSIPFDLVLTMRRYDLRIIFVVSLWTGWIVSMAFAEWWIRKRVPSSEF